MNINQSIFSQENYIVVVKQVKDCWGKKGLGLLFSQSSHLFPSLPFSFPSLPSFSFPFVFNSHPSFPFSSSPIDFLPFCYCSVSFFPLPTSQLKYSSTPTSFTFSSVYFNPRLNSRKMMKQKIKYLYFKKETNWNVGSVCFLFSKVSKGSKYE